MKSGELDTLIIHTFLKIWIEKSKKGQEKASERERERERERRERKRREKTEE